MQKFWEWFAVSPLAQAASVAASAALAWLVENVTSLNLHPLVVVAIVAGVPVLIDALNPEDVRFGKRDEELFDA